MALTQRRVAELEGRLASGLATAKKVLHATRNPRLIGDVPHEYLDKFHVAEFAVRGALLAAEGILCELGLTEEIITSALGEYPAGDAKHTSTITLELTRLETCSFKKAIKRDVAAPTSVVTEVTGVLGAIKAATGLVTVVEEFLWTYACEWQVRIYTGSARAAGIVLKEGVVKGELCTSVKEAPCPERRIPSPIEADVTWVFQEGLWGDLEGFKIDRAAEGCLTPARNPDVSAAQKFFHSLGRWGAEVSGAVETLHASDTTRSYDTSLLSAESLFFPICPYLEGVEEDPEAPGSLVTLTDLREFCGLTNQALREALGKVEAGLPKGGICCRSYSALGLLGSSLEELWRDFEGGIGYIEELLRKQLVAAVGKEVTPADFTEYMEFHCRKLFTPEFTPRPFSIAVRLPGQDPEGSVSIERSVETTKGKPTSQPLPTLTRRVLAAEAPQMSFPLDHSSDVRFKGDVILHASVAHRFSTEGNGGDLEMVLRARQFGGYIVLLGAVTGKGSFVPKHGMILRDRDELRIPLQLAELPSAEEFRDAVASISEEQRRFAEAYRAMHLGSSLFAMCIVQIKPHMEAVLGLPPGSLVQEIQLAHNLMELLIDYHIAADLLAYTPDGFEDPDDVPLSEKLEQVERNVKAMQKVVSTAKNQQKEKLVSSEEINEALREMDRRRPGCTRRRPRRRRVQEAEAGTALGSGGVAWLGVEAEEEEAVSGGGFDASRLPQQLEEACRGQPQGKCLRQTAVSVGGSWRLKYYKTIISDQESETLYANETYSEFLRAFSLLDVLTKAGADDLVAAELHVMTVSTHCFDKTLIDTVVQDNINPVEKVEASLIRVASVLHGVAPPQLLSPAHKERALQYSPHLLEG